MRNYSAAEIVNVGSGDEISIRDLALLIAEITGFRGEIVHDLSKPDGTPRKLLDNSRLLGLGWKPEIPLRDGIASTYAWYQNAASPVLA
jgi:GDP-L-fucose synthase